MSSRDKEVVVVGGSFDKLHIGHRYILRIAFSYGSYVKIGLTSDEFIYKSRKENITYIENYATRLQKLKKFCKKFNKPFIIERIDDIYGMATEDRELTTIIVSEETCKRAVEINNLRLKKGIHSLKIIVAEKVMGNDLIPVSSTRIRKGIINDMGKRVTMLKIEMSVSDKIMKKTAINIIDKTYKNIKHEIHIISNTSTTTETYSTLEEGIDHLLEKYAGKKITADIFIDISSCQIYLKRFECYMKIYIALIIDETKTTSTGISVYCEPQLNNVKNSELKHTHKTINISLVQKQIYNNIKSTTEAIEMAINYRKIRTHLLR
ncbi:MAG: pantetheine-phosphate adenylyltransferase [Candidatus Thermoplasmatota archaeon]|jgi:pantetheine-phosphate adenylyltransferase|nr:pantetheine-phosphate adenylyltransferase [Candidatus Thermoplasmatota archaeon]